MAQARKKGGLNFLYMVSFPVVYGLDARKEAEKIGAYFDK
jgi:hypothetical protein